MRVLIFILIFLSPGLYAQTSDEADVGSELPEEETTPEEVDQDAPIKTGAQQNVFQIECQCPGPLQQEETPVSNSVFPPNTVFFMAPQPTPVPENQEEREVAPLIEGSPPGYGGTLPSSYSDEGYRQIK